MTDSDNSSPFDDITERNPSSNALETTEVRLQMLTLDVDNVSNQQGFEAAENGLVVPEHDGIPETRSEERLLSGSPMISAPSEIGKEIRELSSASVAFVDISSTPETTEEPLQMLTLEASNDVAGVEETPNQQGLGAENGLDVAEHDGRPKPLIEEPIPSSPPMISTASETGEEVRELHSIGVASRDNTDTRETTLERLQLLTSDQWNGVAGVEETSNRQDLGGVESGLVVSEHDERPKPEVLETFASCPPMISTASETGEEAREFYSVGVALRESANTLETTEERLQMLTLEESNGDAGVQETSDQQGLGEAENGLVVPEHDGRPEPEIEVAIESSRPMISAAYETAEEVRVLSSAGIAARDSSEVEADQPLSPSSSGYAGERGSSSSTSASEIKELDGDEIDEMTLEDGPGDASSDSVPWLPGKRHVDEDDASISWRKRKKHFLVLSHSGKPIYSRYGDEYKLAGFSATLQAIISFVENGGDHVKFVRAGKHQVVFLVKGPIYLVCISCTEEPYEALRGQLDLIYGQMILILTKSVNRCFEKNPKFDMTPLLGGTEAVFSSLIHSFSWNPATFLHAYTCLPLPYPTRQAAGAILQDVAESGVLFAILMCKHKVVSLVGAQKASLHPDDMLLLSNFILSSESFRTSESFSPICLPRYNPMAFLYAYVRYLDVDTYLVLLTTSSDAFYHLKDCRIRIEMVLLKSNVLSEVQRSMLDGGLRVEYLPLDPSPRSGSLSPHLGQDRLSLTESPERFKEVYVGIGGPAGLWHFIYRSIYLDQYVSSEFSPPIISTVQQKRLYRAYQKLYASMHHRGIGPHKTQFRRDENYVLLCWMTQDFELYAAFDPLADKALAINTCNRVCQWVRDVENEIFLQGASPFSW